MKDFGRWFSDFTLPAQAPAEPKLPDGVYMLKGRPHAKCWCCEQACDVSEFVDEPDADFVRWYGGCGPRCCP